MKLDYKVLWIEDDDEWIDASKDFLRDIIEDLGFRYLVEFRNGPDCSKEDFDDPSYDLILMDYELHLGINGIKLLDMIKELRVYTDILFYSGKEDQMRDAVRKKGNIDGIYMCNRKDVIDRAEELIEFALKKVLDTNNVRGIVMAEVSRLDSHMKDIIIKAHEDFFDEELKLQNKEKICGRLNGFLDQKVEEIKELSSDEGDSITEIISNFMFDSNKKARSLGWVVEKLKLNRGLSFISNEYTTEVLKKRNKLAHVEDDGSDCAGLSGKELLQIRLDLIKHSDNILKIHDEVFNEYDE